jgi:FkbM family methyltransferase
VSADRRYWRFLWSHEAAVHRYAVRLANAVLRLVPFRAKYFFGMLLRRRRFPYALIRPGDAVVQVGAPRDTLRSGRSRAFYFSLLVGPSGRAVVVEPDAESALAFRAAAARYHVGNVTVIEAGAWSQDTMLRVYVDDAHPASNFTDGAKRYDERRLRDYRIVEVPAVRLDRALARLGIEHIRLISITTNGAEREILGGLSDMLGPRLEYVALADTGAVDERTMEEYGYRPAAHDDRGRTYAYAPGTSGGSSG